MTRPVLSAALGLLACLTVACAADDTDPATGSAPAAGPTSDDHGEVSGAVELDEPAVGLTTVDATGVVRHLDLLDESTVELADLAAPTAVHTDGRFAYVRTADGLDVVDSGVWTWDHEDHFHYYRAEARAVGRVDGRGPAAVATTASSTSGGAGVFFAGSGEAVMLDVGALADGEVVETYRTRVRPHDGLLVPVGEHALVTGPGPRGQAAYVEVLDAGGSPVGRRRPCRAAAGTVTTRVGAVVGCADGALLARVVDDELQVERIPYPDGTDAPAATSFHGRDGRPSVAGLAGPDRYWVLDTREQTWTLHDAPVPLVQVSAVDDADENLLGVTTEGRLVVLDAATGELRATSGPLVAASLRAGTTLPPLVVDQQRAYLAGPAERRLFEVDFADDARVARSFATPTEPVLLAGTGR